MHCTNGGEGQAEGRGEGQMHCTSCVEDGGAEGGGRRGGANALYQLCGGWGS